MESIAEAVIRKGIPSGVGYSIAEPPTPKEHFVAKERAFRHTATYNACSCSVDRTGGTPVLSSHSITKHRKNYLVRDSLSFVYLAMTYFPRSYVQVSSALEVLTSVFGMGTGGTPPA